ncbi:MAG TPA: hypothetical protein EYP21_10890 [Syntrophaceae bacterium]|nr:hypothetical protein [Syntrophaceae bacterium]
MPRKKRTKEELIEASDHLYYEIWMFLRLANGMGSGVFGQGVLNNALLESFTVHTRILLDFLYAERPQKDDVIAEDFFEDPSIWINARPPKSDTLQKVHRRVAKEVAHLTYARQDVTPETKPWPFVEIANEVNTIFSKFLSLIPLELLGPRWNDYIEKRKKGEAG